MNNLTHVRRCHVCGEVSENKEQDVERCNHCKKPLAQFCFFDDRRVLPLSDDRKAGDILDAYQPIRGLTAYWDHAA